MNKRYILLFIGVIIFFSIFIVFIFFQQSQPVPNPSSLQNQNPAKLQQTTQKISTVPSVKLAPLTGSAQEAARQFYLYYFSKSENPLARGQYKTNPYLTQEFKDLLEVGYNNGNAPIFCPQNKRANITVGKEVQVYYSNQYLRQETISEAPSGTKDLYTIMLENNNGNWLVEDVNCIY